MTRIGCFDFSLCAHRAIIDMIKILCAAVHLFTAISLSRVVRKNLIIDTDLFSDVE